MMSNIISQEFDLNSNTHLNSPSNNRTLLEEIGKRLKAKRNRYFIAHYRAIKNWLTKYSPIPGVSKLEMVKGYLETFYHLTEIDAWEAAGLILCIESPNPMYQSFHHQLGNWGYYSEQLTIYNRLLHKLDSKFDAVCLSEMGLCYHALGKFRKAIDHYERSLDCVRSLSLHREEGPLLNNLGLSFFFLGEYKKSINYYQERILLAWKYQDYEGEGAVLINLGLIFHAQDNFQKASKYIRYGLKLLYLGKNRFSQSMALGTMGIICGELGLYDLAILCQEHQGRTVREIENVAGEASLLGNMGVTFVKTNRYTEALPYFQEAIKICRQIGNLYAESSFLLNMAKTYALLENFDLALKHCNRALEIAIQLDLPLREDYKKLQKFLMSESLKSVKLIDFNRPYFL